MESKLVYLSTFIRNVLGRYVLAMCYNLTMCYMGWLWLPGLSSSSVESSSWPKKDNYIIDHIQVEGGISPGKGLVRTLLFRLSLASHEVLHICYTHTYALNTQLHVLPTPYNCGPHFTLLIPLWRNILPIIAATSLPPAQWQIQQSQTRRSPPMALGLPQHQKPLPSGRGI